MSFKNYYDTLGVKNTATNEEIKQAYRKLSMKFHPDKNGGDAFMEEMFKSINEANEILSNSEKRTEYDNTLQLINTSINNSNSSLRNSSKNENNGDNRIIELILIYFEKEKVSNLKQDVVNNIKYTEKPNYIDIKRALFTVFVMLILVLFFKPKANESTDIESQISGFEYVTNTNASIYSKPDETSKIIGEIEKGTGINSLKTTKYFIKISFVNKNGVDKKGYIKKIFADSNTR